jgi:hypothetical protein
MGPASEWRTGINPRHGRCGQRAASALLCAFVLAWAGCGQPAGPGPTPPVVPPPDTTIPDAFLVGAGDIGECGSPGPGLTAGLIAPLEGTVFTTGDNAYPSGTTDDFAKCYAPTWGAFRARTRPTAGNHEYYTLNAAPYYAYFGDLAGPAGLGYYSYTVGAWHVIALNTNIASGAGSAQEQWLRADLQANPAPCTMAYWHHPLYSSGPHGNDPQARALWAALYEFKADVVLTGHDHDYERFAPQDAFGRLDQGRGIREFVVGTGGASNYKAVGLAANSEVQDSGGWGVLRLTLKARSYEWQFLPVPGYAFRDSGSALCVQ